MAVCHAVTDYGLDCEPLGLHGQDFGRLLETIERDPPDLVFNLCESLNGDTRNEIVVPAVLDMLRIPYTGPGPLTIGLCLDKDRTKQVLIQHGVATPAHHVIGAMDELDDPAHPFGPRPAALNGNGHCSTTRSSSSSCARTRPSASSRPTWSPIGRRCAGGSAS